ncbi:LexA family protein [Streptomyces sp. NPDC048603]|uniref:LexA family protein n=1 Tax=Streptomyces sp. NPDC048603 TaxID=3365577 RepID=UPI00371D9175
MSLHASSLQGGAPHARRRIRSPPWARPVSRPGPDGLTTRQTAIVTFIDQAVACQGYPPSMREIGEGVHLRSTSSVAHQLLALEKKGVLYRDPHQPRAYRVRRGTPADHFGTSADTAEAVEVPLVGRIAASALDGEATVKRLRRENGQVWLIPHNAAYQPIPGDGAAILGKVVAVLRAL